MKLARTESSVLKPVWAWVIVLIATQVITWLVMAAWWWPNQWTTEVSSVFLRDRVFFPREYDLEIYRSWIIIVLFLGSITVITYQRYQAMRLWLDLISHKRSLMMGIISLGVWFLSWINFRESGPSVLKAMLLMLTMMVNLSILLWPQRALDLLSLGLDRLWPYLRRGHWLSRLSMLAICPIVIKAFSQWTIWFNATTLPYFWPLRSNQWGIFSLSFFIIIFYMGTLLWALQRILNLGITSRRLMMLGASVLGLTLHIFYLKQPIPEMVGVSTAMSWPLMAMIIESLGERRDANHPISDLENDVREWLFIWLGSLWSGLLLLSLKEIGVRLPQVFYPWGVYLGFIFCGIFGGGIIFLIKSKWRLMWRWGFGDSCWLGVWIIVMAIALFKIMYFDQRALLARWALSGSWVVGLIWFIYRRWADQIVSTMRKITISFWWHGLSILVIILLVSVNDVKALTAHVFFGEYFAHSDQYIMGPLWSYVNGGIIDENVYARYGIGTIPIFAWGMRLLGGITYEHFFYVLIFLSMVYFLGVYLVFWKWFRHWASAVLGCLCVIKAHLCFDLAFPFVYTYPQATVTRQLPEIFFILLLIKWAETEKTWFLWAAGLMVGLSFWYMPSVGIYMGAALGFILALEFLRRQYSIAWFFQSSALVGWMIFSAGLLFYLLCGPAIFTAKFWGTSIDFMRMFLLTNTAPLNTFMQNGQGWNLLMFLIIILTYVGTMLWALMKILNQEKVSPFLMVAAALGVYGCGLIEHFVTFSISNNFYTKSLPFFILMIFWLHQAITQLAKIKFKMNWQSHWETIVDKSWFFLNILALIALFSHDAFASYPHLYWKEPLMNPQWARPLPNGAPYLHHKNRLLPQAMLFTFPGANQWDRYLVSEYDLISENGLKQQYEAMSNFSVDARLIRSWTKPNEPVALLCGMEVAILMQAKRKPFFFFFPVLSTLPPWSRALPYDFLDKEEDVRRLLADLDERKPQMVFLHHLMMRDDIPAIYGKTSPGLLQLIVYVRQHYTPVDQGQYLVAMQRKSP